jgi:hypothetical protein
MYNVQLLSCLLSARWDVMRSGRFARFGEDGSSLVQPFTNLPQNLGLLDNNDRYQRALRGDSTLSHSDSKTLLPLMGRPLLGDTMLHGTRLEYGQVSLYSVLQVFLAYL